ncbi:MAG: 4Fe-4S binding protein [Dethiobacter sp.]|nr:4Fe-4S binding protein [Dethiobacter sp.]
MCDDCVNACPRQARKRDGDSFEVDLTLCGGCGSCAAACKGGAIRMVPR